jgi:hypothetical protein
MPYFVFKINNHREYDCLGEYEAYRDARMAVRERRRDQPERGLIEYRMVFAESAPQAEALLRAPRERIPSEDD